MPGVLFAGSDHTCQISDLLREEQVARHSQPTAAALFSRVIAADA